MNLFQAQKESKAEHQQSVTELQVTGNNCNILNDDGSEEEEYNHVTVLLAFFFFDLSVGLSVCREEEDGIVT